MDLNKLLKIVIIVAILIISFSVFYRYVIYLPKQQILKEQKEKEEKLTSYRIKYQEECEKNYEDLYEAWKNQDFGDMAGFVLEQRDKMCKERVNWFDIDSFIYCSDGNDYGHTRDSYVPACINWKMKQINL